MIENNEFLSTHKTYFIAGLMFIFHYSEGVLIMKEKNEKITTVRLEKELHFLFKRYCLEQDITMTDFFRKKVIEAVGQEKRKGEKNEE